MDALSGLLQPAFKSSKQFNELLSGVSSQPSRQTSSREKQVVQSSAVLLDSVLARIPGASASEQQVSVSGFSPQAVADRIIGFVGASIQQRAGSEAEVQSMLQQAKEGIAQGVSEARDILDSLGQLSGEIERQVNETESLIFQGLEQLEQSLTQPPVQRPGRAAVVESGVFSSQFKQTSEASIEIVTRDGDRVEVSYSAFVQSDTRQRFAADDSAFSFSSRQQTNSTVAFQFSVEGSLDAEERTSINELLNEIGDIAGQFFQGDVQAAFNASLELGFDSEELASFSLDFQQTTRVQVAEAYQRTEQLSDLPSSVQVPASVNPRPAVNVLAQLDNLIEQVKDSELIEEPENTLKSLLVEMLDLLNQTPEISVQLSPVQSYIKEIIDIY